MLIYSEQTFIASIIFLTVLRHRSIGWKRGSWFLLLEVPRVVEATFWGTAVIVCVCVCLLPAFRNFFSNCQAKFARIHLFLDQYRFSPQIAFLCPLPAVLSALHREIKGLLQTDSCFSLPISISSSALFLPHPSFTLNSSLPAQDQPVPFLGTGNLIILCCVWSVAGARCLLPHASIWDGAQQEPCLSPG